MTNARDELATAIRRVRRERGLTIHEAAEQVGVHRVTWQNWESGVKEPSRVSRFALEAWIRRPVKAQPE